MRILLDTNILVRLADSSQPLHSTATSAIRALQANSDELTLVPQVLYEFWTVATRTLKANGLGETPAFAESFILKFCNTFRLLRDERGIYEEWFDLVNKHQISGVNSYDTRLAAAMSRHSVTHLLTFNPSDFRRYSHINIIDPASV